MNDLQPVLRRKERLGDLLYGQILERILSGALKEGDKLPSESELCRSSNVSRPTVREALLRLHADGLVTTRQGSGTYVQRRPSEHLTRLAKASDVAEMLRCFEVRLPLESQAAALAAQRRTPAQVERIFHALDALRTGFADGGVPARLDLDFHQAVAAASGNPLFPEVLETLSDTIRHIMAVALDITREGSQERKRRVFEEHEAVAEAIRSGDAEAAALTMRYHLYRAQRRMIDGRQDR